MALPCVLWGIYGDHTVLGTGSGTIRVIANGEEQTVNWGIGGTIEDGTAYYVAGDGSAVDLLDILRVTLESASWEIIVLGSPVTVHPDVTVTQNGAGIVTITSDVAFSILGGDAESTVDLSIFGLNNDDTFATVDGAIVAPVKHRGAWYPGIPVSDDTLDTMPIVGAGARTLSGTSRIVRVATAFAERDVAWDLLDGGLVREELADEVDAPQTFEAGFVDFGADGAPLRLYPDHTVRTSESFRLYRLREEGLETPWERATDDLLWWNVKLRMVRC
jgi:hypothetical protein